ncbi:MAG: hypothetical protein KGH71_05055 [Candidatus Micrarchaeota archaeon]|nr:hypothetical protein [Candidatus Micrarchaeota archaeon]
MEKETEKIELAPIIIRGAAGRELCIGFYRHEARAAGIIQRASQFLHGAGALRI